MSLHTIKEAATRVGLPSKTLRYYEEEGLIAPGRGANGYRVYDDRDLHRLQFLARARRLGFTIEECRELMGLWDDRHRASADVKRLAEHKIEDMEKRIAELEALKSTLSDLAHRCHGDDRPDCPILADLAGDNAPA